MAFRQIKSPALADKAVINTKLDESAVQGQSTLTGMVNPADCFTLLYDVGSDSLKKIGADAFFASFSTDDLQEGRTNTSRLKEQKLLLQLISQVR